MPLLLSEISSLNSKKKIKMVKVIHEKACGQIKKKSQVYVQRVKKGRKQVVTIEFGYICTRKGFQNKGSQS